MLLGINHNFLGVYVGGPLLLYSGSTKVLPGPPKYLPHQCPHRVRLVPEIMPDPPLHSAQIILVLGIRSSIFLTRNVFGHYGGWTRHYFGREFGLYSSSSKVLPGPPRYLPYRFPQRFDLVPKIAKSLMPSSSEQLNSLLKSRRKIPQTSQVCFDGSWLPPTPSMSMFLAGWPMRRVQLTL